MRKMDKTYEEKLIEALPTPMLITTLDGKIISANSRCEDFFGRSKGQIIAVIIEDLYEERSNVREAFEEAKRTEFSTCDVTCLKGDGATFPAILNFAPIKDEDGNVINVLVAMSDLTKLKEREKEVEDARVYAENLVKFSPTPITLLTPDGIRTDCNSAMERLTGRKKRELLEAIEEIYAEESKEDARKIVKEAVEKGSASYELTIVKKDGTKVPVIANTSVIRDGSGEVTGVIYTASDLTELKEKEREIEENSEYLQREAEDKRGDEESIRGIHLR
jgi:PAS domain S-box